MPAPRRHAELTLSTPISALSQFPNNHDQIHLNAAEWNMLALVLQQLNAGQIVSRTGYSAEHVLQMLNNLIDRGMVVMISSPAAPEPRPTVALPEQKQPTNQVNRFNHAIQRRLSQCSSAT